MIYPSNILKPASPAVIKINASPCGSHPRSLFSRLAGYFRKARNRRGRRLHYWLAICGGVK